LRILEYFVSEPEVKRVSPEDFIVPGGVGTLPFNGAVAAAPKSRTVFETS
jgi:hypothetical protein